MVEIREATKRDLDVLIELWKEFVSVHDKLILAKNPKLKPYQELKKDAPARVKRWWIKELKDKKLYLLIAEDKGKPIGFCAAGIEDRPSIFKIDKTIQVTDLYVKEKYRGQKISSRFAAKVKQWAKAKKIRDLSLHVYIDNPKAWQIYKRWGFIERGVLMFKRIR